MHCIAFVTAPSLDAARKLADIIFERRLAACVNLVPGVESHYWWEGKRCTDEEVLMVLKTPADRLAALEECVRSEHPYDTPEFVALNIEHGSTRYLDWLTQSTR